MSRPTAMSTRPSARWRRIRFPFTEGGYGKPLGHKRDGNLTGYLKVKLRGEGLRVVYRLERTVHSMTVVVVSVRDDNTVYKEAARRIKKDLA